MQRPKQYGWKANKYTAVKTNRRAASNQSTLSRGDYQIGLAHDDRRVGHLLHTPSQLSRLLQFAP